MGYKILGGICVLLGTALIALGIARVVSAEQPKGAKSQVAASQTSETGEVGAYAEKEKFEVVSGVYVCYETSEAIELFDDATFTIGESERAEYKLKTWEIPVTDEISGKITFANAYYLGTNLNGGVHFTEKIAYDYENSSLIYGGKTYVLSAR